MPLDADRRNGPPAGPAASALILVVDPDRALPPSAAQLRQLYGLTHAESEVAVAAVRGEGLSAIAADLDVSLATARTHLQHVFEKTGTRRQAELVRLILASGVNLREAGADDTPRHGLAPTAPPYRDAPPAPRAWSAGGGA
jgi:DNA-binding CsgD family transcriptional regulator